MLIVRGKNTEKAENFRKENESCFLIKNGSRYLGSFIRERVLETEWVEEKIEKWGKVVESVAKMDKYVPQLAYAGIQRVLQQEWNFLQRVVPEIGPLFSKLEETIHKSFFGKLK